MVIDSFKQKQRNLLLELADNYEDIFITEVSEDIDSTDVNVKIYFRLISDREKFINDFGSLVKEYGGLGGN